MIKEYLKFTINYNLPSDTFVLFGVGSTQLFAAYYFAVQRYLNKKIIVSSFVPEIYYTLHRDITFTLPNMDWEDNLNNPDILVYVSPNNPNGLIANINNLKSGKYNVFDVVYDVPLFTGKFETINKELYEKFDVDNSYTIISSFSKLGLSGARCGFLLTRDINLIEGIRFYIENNSLVPPSLGITLTRNVFNTYYLNKDWYDMNYNKLKNRIGEFIELSEGKHIKILNITFNVPFIYNDKSAEWWLNNYNVIVRSGIDFADTPEHSRFNLMISDNEWNNFIKRFSCN
jgi:aspartate/methionine/tyrosine aminotransferase